MESKESGQGGLPSQTSVATGVVVSFGGGQRRLRIRARVVAACAGALHTPALLLRSGIKSRGLVGSNLRLHPATCIVGVLPPQVCLLSHASHG